jgi:hypothetical protein
MEPKRRRELALAALVAVLGGSLYLAVEGWPFGTSDTSANPTSASNGQGRTAKNGRGAPAAAEGPGVHLDALEAARPKPGEPGRNLFRFQPKPPPRAPAQPPPPVGPSPVAVQAGPAAPPPITLKFIGIIDAGQSRKIVAVLTDGRGVPVYGSEGETILGQYRILRIGTESIEMSYLDGRGRQTIRFTGS